MHEGVRGRGACDPLHTVLPICDAMYTYTYRNMALRSDMTAFARSNLHADDVLLLLPLTPQQVRGLLLIRVLTLVDEQRSGPQMVPV